MEQMKRTMTLNREKVNEDERTIELSFSSEAPYERYFGSEILSHDPGAIDLSRMEEVGVLLFAHGRDANYGRMPIGSVEKVWLDEEQMKARALVRFDDDEDSDKVYQKVKKGMIKGVSVGYSVSSWEEVKAGKASANGRFTGPAYVALKWQPYEISIEPTPADPSVGVGRSQEEPPKTSTKNESGEMNMPPENNEQQKPDTSVNTKAIKEEGVTAERTRVTEITNLCRNFGMDPTDFIANGNPIDFVKDAILQKQADDRAPNPGKVQVRTEESDKFRAAASDGLLMRAGRNVENPAAGAYELRGLRLRDVAVECLRRVGEDQAHLMSDEALLKRALMPDSQFQAIMSNAVNKTLSASYQEAPTTFQYWTSRGSNSDFKAAEHYRMSEAGELERLPQNGLIPYDEGMKDEKVTKAVLTYAKRWGFTREAFINDDLSMLNRVPAAYVISAKRGINKLVYKMLASNPVIFDGKPLFDAAHNNLGTPGPINTDSMSDARVRMRTQKDLRGNATLNIAPKYLLVPAALETSANQYMRSEADPAAAHSGVANVFRNSYTTVVDAELDQYSADAWYLAADQNIADTIEVTYLRGQDQPTLETEIPFDRLGMDFRIYFDYGVTVLDHVGLFKNDGK